MMKPARRHFNVLVVSLLVGLRVSLLTTMAYSSSVQSPPNMSTRGLQPQQEEQQPSPASVWYDDHTQPHSRVTLAQMTFFLACVIAGVMWLARLSRRLRRPPTLLHAAADEAEKGLPTLQAYGAAAAPAKVEVDGGGLPCQKGDAIGGGGGGDASSAKLASPSATASGPPPVPGVDEILKDVVAFGVIMLYFFLCDYIKILPESPRVYNRDQFLFFVFLLFAAGFAFTLKPNKDVILNRDMTEEWKGWMQVLFVWYHYFAAAEWYNWIRVYIACYVWMTGFGNFSFFWVRGDYSLWRVLKMLFRMNFLVIAVVTVTANEYMLYYICAMHTYWFLTVYAFMATFTSWNTHRWKMAAKFLAYIVCNAIVFEIPGMASFLFRPLWFIFQLHYKGADVMHEWEFRAGLDHWACLLGMLCAYNYPRYRAFLSRLESRSETPKEAACKLWARVALGAGAGLGGLAWYWAFMRAEKLAYNATHCYTSLLPILAYLVLRNLHPALRRHHLGLFAALGKITLETYLSQLHVYLQSNAKHLLGYIPGYPLLTFALATAVYLGVSRLLFDVTLSFSAFFIQKEWRRSLRALGVGCGVVLASLVASAGVLATARGRL